MTFTALASLLAILATIRVPSFSVAFGVVLLAAVGGAVVDRARRRVW